MEWLPQFFPLLNLLKLFTLKEVKDNRYGQRFFDTTNFKILHQCVVRNSQVELLDLCLEATDDKAHPILVGLSVLRFESFN